MHTDEIPVNAYMQIRAARGHQDAQVCSGVDPDVVHIVWSPATGPIDAYWVPARADEHARTMLGVDVTACELRVGGVLSREIWVVWSPVKGPIVAFFSDRLAHAHARDISGGVRVTCCEIRAQVPAGIRDDVYIAELEDFDDDDTPIDERPPLKRS